MISTAKRRANITTERIAWARQVARSGQTVADIAKVLRKTPDQLRADLRAARKIAADTAVQMEAAINYLAIVNAPAQHENPPAAESRV